MEDQVMLERMHIDGMDILTPCIEQHDHGWLVAETRWRDENDREMPLVLARERTTLARAGFLCEPHFNASAPGVRTLRCTRGELFLVVADVRRGSPTFGQWQSIELSADRFQVVRVSTELACGYLVTSDAATIED